MTAAVSPNLSKLSTFRSRFGLQPEAPLDEDHRDLAHHDLVWSRIRLTMREPFAEFFGTFIMVLFGDGSVAQVLEYSSRTPSKCLALRTHRWPSLLVRKLPLVRMALANTSQSLGGESYTALLVDQQSGSFVRACCPLF